MLKRKVALIAYRMASFDPTPKDPSTATILLYMEDGELLECDAIVQAVDEAEDGTPFVSLDRTVCYPQGGGQGSDTGIIRSANASFEIQKAVLDKESGQVLHNGKWRCPHKEPEAHCVDRVEEPGNSPEHTGENTLEMTHVSGRFIPGDSVKVRIDAKTRELHSRLHTAGHAIDAAIASLGYRFTPARGNHFPNQSWVEYKSALLGGEDASKFAEKIQDEVQKMIAADVEVSVKTNVPHDEALKLCGGSATDQLYPDAPNLRLIGVGSFFGPCGGTHVTSLSKLKGVQVPKIKATKSKQLIKVYYDVADK